MKNAIKIIEALLEEDGDEKRLRTTARTPFPSNYRPELDITQELGPEMASEYMQLIGIARWAVELGPLDIYNEYLSCHNIRHFQGKVIWKLYITCLLT